MTEKTFGLPFVVWCGVLGAVLIVGLAAFAYGRRNALRARPVPGRVLRVSHRTNASGKVQSVLAEVAVPDPQGGKDTVILTFPDGETGGVWAGRELTLWQRPNKQTLGKQRPKKQTPPRLNRPGPSKRCLPAAGLSFAALVFIVDIHVAHISENTKAALVPFGVVFAASCAVPAAINLAQLLKTRRILRGTPAAGRIIGLVRHETTNQDNTTSTTYRPIVAFTTADGRQVLGLTTTATSTRKRWTGRDVQVRHRPDHPETFRLATPSESWAPAFNLLFSALLVAGGLVAVFSA